MLRRVQAKNFRCLRDVDVSLGRSVHILVGPNGSGKSALFDAVAFFRDSMTDGVEAAVSKRTNNFQDLVWARPKGGMGFELALEFDDFGTIKKLPFGVVKFMLQAREQDDGGLVGEVWVDLLQASDTPSPGSVFEPAGDHLVQMKFGPDTPPEVALSTTG